MTVRTFVLAATMLALSTANAEADVYKAADFTIGVFGGDANQQPPFAGVVAPYPAGGQFTGTLVYDQNLVPGSGSGVVNVLFSSFPDIGAIPPATALSFQLGSLPGFDLAGAQVQFGTQEAGIQYNNGVFAGLFYIADFTYQANPYELQIQGGSLSIVAILDGYPTFQSLVNGYVDWGLSNVRDYTIVTPPPPPPPPPTTTPEPLTLALFGMGLVGLTALRRRKAAV